MTAMHPLSDLKVIIAQKDVPEGFGTFTEFPFHLTLTSGRPRPYAPSVEVDSEEINGRPATGGTSNVRADVLPDGSLLVAADRHGLPPGRLWATLTVRYPDPAMPDGERAETREWDTGVVIDRDCRCPGSDGASVPTVEVAPAVLYRTAYDMAAAAGFTGTQQEYEAALANVGKGKTDYSRQRNVVVQRGVISLHSQPGVVYRNWGYIRVPSRRKRVVKIERSSLRGLDNPRLEFHVAHGKYDSLPTCRELNGKLVGMRADSSIPPGAFRVYYDRNMHAYESEPVYKCIVKNDDGSFTQFSPIGDMAEVQPPDLTGILHKATRRWWGSVPPETLGELLKSLKGQIGDVEIQYRKRYNRLTAYMADEEQHRHGVDEWFDRGDGKGINGSKYGWAKVGLTNGRKIGVFRVRGTIGRGKRTRWYYFTFAHGHYKPLR